MYFYEASIDSHRITNQLIETLPREHEATYVLPGETSEQRVAQIRASGRTAGRRIGRSVRTHAVSPTQQDNRWMVTVWINDLTEDERREGQRQALREHGIKGTQ